MSKEFDNTNRFALFPNKNMREDKNDPDLSGFINIDGQDYWFKGWTSYNRDGSPKVISGVIGEEREAQEPKPVSTKKRPNSKR
jgi:hypothetical protein